MRKLFWLAVLVAVFYGHSHVMFSEPAVMSWMNKQERLALDGDEKMCDAYASDLKVQMRMQAPEGATVLEGGKAELCQFMKDAQAALKMTRASVNMSTELVSVERSGFPWMTATVKTQQTSTVQMGRMPPVTEVTEATLVIERTLQGRQISSIESSSSVAADR
jgi:hypothetical protein